MRSLATTSGAARTATRPQPRGGRAPGVACCAGRAPEQRRLAAPAATRAVELQQQRHQQRQQQHPEGATRRAVVGALLSSPPLALLGGSAARAEQAPPAEAPAPTPAAGAADPSSALERFLDNDYELEYPSNFAYVETAVPVVERGPQPERSPVLARFEAPGGQPGTVSVLMRRAQVFKQTILQVADISQLGDPVEVARLILPRGSTLLATATQQVPQPPKQTPLGVVELPPQNYYIYDFTTTDGLHVAMAAAAKKGTVIICGASTTPERWPQAAPVFARVVRSFRIRSQPTIS